MELRELIEIIPEVSPEAPFVAVTALMSDSQAKVAAVIADRKLLGIILESDIIRQSAIPELNTSVLVARNVMTTSIEQMPVSTPTIDAANAMRSRRLQYLALTDDAGDFAGLVTLRRILFEVMDELGLKVDNLERELMADGPGG